MRILCVTDHLNSGGAQRQLVHLACGFKQRGHHVEFFTYYPQDFLKSKLDKVDIPTHLCAKKRRLSLAPVLGLRRLVRERAFDIVLAFLETPVVYAELACTGIAGVRVIASERNTSLDGRVTAGRLVKSRLHMLSRSVVVNTYAHRAWMAKHFPYLRSRLVTIWNGVDTEAFQPVESDANTGHLRLLGVGRITRQKNLRALAVALAECRKRHLRVTLDWAGETDDQSYYADVLADIGEHQLGHTWRWLGVRRDIPTLLHGYDALILPSLWEGMPNAICEALSTGLPVLASNVSDNARLVQDGTTGFTFDPKQPSSIANAIQRYSEMDVDTRTKLRREARAFAMKELSLERCLAAYESLFDAGS